MKSPSVHDVTVELVARHNGARRVIIRGRVEDLANSPSAIAIALIGTPWIDSRVRQAGASEGTRPSVWLFEAELPALPQLEPPLEIFIKILFAGNEQRVFRIRSSAPFRLQESSQPNRDAVLGRLGHLNGNSQGVRAAQRWRTEWLSRFGPVPAPPEGTTAPRLTVIHLSECPSEVAATAYSLPADGRVELLAVPAALPTVPLPVAVRSWGLAAQLERWSSAWWQALLAASSADLLLLLDGPCRVLAGALDALLAASERPGTGMVCARHVSPHGWWDGDVASPYPTAFLSQALHRRTLHKPWSTGALVHRAPLTAVLPADPRAPCSLQEIGRCLQERGLVIRYEPAAVAIQPLSVGASEWCSIDDGVREGRKVRTVLMMEDPDRLLDAPWKEGDVRTVVEGMLELGYRVICYPPQRNARRWRELLELLPENVEVAYGGLERFPNFLRERGGEIDIIWASRCGTVAAYANLIEVYRRDHPELLVVHQLGGLPGVREILRQQVVAPRELPASYVDLLLGRDTIPSRGADLVIADNEFEAKECAVRGLERVCVLGSPVRAPMSAAHCGERSGVCVIGSALAEESPTADGILWMFREVMPKLHAVVDDGAARLTLAGGASMMWERQAKKLWPLTVEQPSDIPEFLQHFRVLAAPRRYDAGLARDLVWAASCGIPVVCTGVVAHQLGWKHGEQAFVANTAHEFADGLVELLTSAVWWERLRDGARRWAETVCDRAAWLRRLQEVVEMPPRRNATVLDLLDVTAMQPWSSPARSSAQTPETGAQERNAAGGTSVRGNIDLF